MDGRTAMLHARAARRHVPFVKDEKGNYCLQRKGRQDALLMSRNIRNFHQSLVTVDSSLDVEIIELAGDSKELQEVYQSLKEKIGMEKDPIKIMDITIQFVRESLGAETSSTAKVDQFIEEYKAAEYYHGKPIIPITAFIKAKLGVCRHNVTLLSYLLYSISQDADYNFPKSRVYYHCSNVVADENTPTARNGAHAWVMFEIGTPSKLYHLDSFWYNKAHEVTGDPAADPILLKYGRAAAAASSNRYYQSAAPILQQLKKSAAQTAVTVLLDEKKLERLKKLNCYSAADVINIQLELVSVINKNDPRRISLEADIALVQSTSTLHAKPFTQHAVASDQQIQFVAGLLVQDFLTRSQAYKNQTLVDLDALKKILANEVYKPYFQHYQNYASIVAEINSVITAKTTAAAPKPPVDHKHEQKNDSLNDLKLQAASDPAAEAARIKQIQSWLDHKHQDKACLEIVNKKPIELKKIKLTLLTRKSDGTLLFGAHENYNSLVKLVDLLLTPPQTPAFFTETTNHQGGAGAMASAAVSKQRVAKK